MRLPDALRVKPFRRLTVAWIFANLADSALYLMLAVWTKDLTGNDAAAATVFIMLGIPALLAPIFGQIADRVSRKRVLVGANLGVAIVVLSLLTVRGTEGIWLIYAVMLIYASIAYLNMAAQTGLVRDLLSDEQLASGNGLLTTLDQALRLISPLIGTALYALWGAGAVVILTAVCFGTAAAILTQVKVKESEPETADERGTYWHEVTAGFRQLARNPILGRLTFIIAVAFGATGLVNVAVFPILEKGLHLPTSALGPLVSIQGIGAVIAGLTAAKVIGAWGEVRVFGLGILILGFGFLPGVVPNVVVFALGLTAIGFGVTWSVVAFVTLRQRLTPARLQARTGAATSIAINLPQTLVTVFAAAIIGVVDFRILVLVTGVVCLLALAAMPFGKKADGVGAGAQVVKEVETDDT